MAPRKKTGKSDVSGGSDESAPAEASFAPAVGQEKPNTGRLTPPGTLPHGRGSVFSPAKAGTPSTFADEVRNFLREPVPPSLRTEATARQAGADGDNQGGGGGERLRVLLERLCEEDPKSALQFLCSYAFGKPAERLDVSATVAGVPEKFIELFREHARNL